MSFKDRLDRLRDLFQQEVALLDLGGGAPAGGADRLEELVGRHRGGALDAGVVLDRDRLGRQREVGQ